MKKILSGVLTASVLTTTILTAVPALAKSNYVIKVTANNMTRNYSSFEEGWVAALESAEDYQTTVKLLSDWYAGDTNSNGIIDSGETAGYFKTLKDGAEYGTNNGRLYLYDDEINLTIDLNGYTLSRNLENPVANGQVFDIEDGSLTIKDTSEAQTGKITGANNVGEGGAFYVYNGSLYIQGGQITGNKCTERGAGIYWNSSDTLCLTGGKITGNEAGWFAGGVLVRSTGSAYVGGTIFISGNTNDDGEADNLAMNSSDTELNLAMGQKVGVPVAPFAEGAHIGIDCQTEDNILFSGSDAKFDVGSHKYFSADDENFYIRPVYEANSGNGTYKLYYTSRTNSSVKRPCVNDVSVKDSSLIKRASINRETQVITLTALNTKKNAFEYAALENLIEYDLNADAALLIGSEDICNLLSTREYKVLANDDTYVLCTVKVVPEGGQWAEEQDEVVNNYVMSVYDGDRVRSFTDFNTGWVEAVKSSRNLKTTVTLLADWIATDGKFYCKNGGSEYGTDKGRLHLDDSDADLVIDLNGHTINRNLSSATEHGQVFRVEDGSLTIKDSSQSQTGRITGGNNNGNGGAFYMDNGSLYIEGGQITGNKCSGNGGGIYWYSSAVLCITGGEITANTANGKGDGAYICDWGDIYIGGDAVITGNGSTNVYFDDNDIDLNHAMGQSVNIPYAPLTEGANIGIYAIEDNDLISDTNSKFRAESFKYLHADNSSYFIRSVYDANGGNNTHKLYYNTWGHEDAKYPRITSVVNENTELLESAVLDYNTQIITLKAFKNKKDSFDNIALDSLISYEVNAEDTYIAGSDITCEIYSGVEYKTMSGNGTYVMCIIEIEWLDCTHNDSDGDRVCDDCQEYIYSGFAIIDYNIESKEATVLTPIAGKYMLLFADFENNRFKESEIMEYDFKEGINIVPQKNSNLVLGNGDKVMLWIDGIDCVPLCKPWDVK